MNSTAYEVHFIAHNMPAPTRTQLVSRHEDHDDALEAARNYAQGAAKSARGGGAIVGECGDSVPVYIDGYTLWSEFYVEAVA